jgi:hypothetical protein
MTIPLNPCSPTTRSSSARAAGGSPIGSAAKPKNRVGWRRTASASAAFAREGLRLLDLELFDAGRGQRQRLHVDAGRIHRCDPAIADVDEVGDELRKPAADPLSIFLQPAFGAVQEGGRGEVFFESDRAHEFSTEDHEPRATRNPDPSEPACDATVFAVNAFALAPLWRCQHLCKPIGRKPFANSNT